MSVLSAPSPDEEPSQDSARPSPRPQIALPDPNIHEGRDATFHVHAQVSGEHTILGGRDIAVMLPREHTQDPKRRFPVLFMLDGENLFESLPSTFQGPKWQVAKTCRCLINEGAMEPVIIVAISNGGNAARMADYTHKSHPEWPEGATGFAHNFAAFLYTQLIPVINDRYPTLPERTGIIGSSLGGLFCLFSKTEFPDHIQRIGALSPSLQWDDGELVRRYEYLQNTGARIFLAAGAQESAPLRGFTSELFALMREAGWDVCSAYPDAIDPRGKHSELSWREQLKEMLPRLYPY
ncbi:MAG: alpha/beta hydrolase [Bdellovibrionales bacterium]|nr:alpha/beta hydrolase [Bdellovibrionales bacterium]